MTAPSGVAFRLVVAMLAVGAFGLPAPVLADGPSGSTEEENQVTCGPRASAVPGADGYFLYVSEDGVEACNQSGPGLQGRIIVTTGPGGYFTIDGDADNPEFWVGDTYVWSTRGSQRYEYGPPLRYCGGPRRTDGTEPCP